jgi:hypothetical protein
MHDVAELINFPSTPEEMHIMLTLESKAKRDRGLTHRGMNGYMYVQAGMAIVDLTMVEVRVGVITG